MQRIHDHIKEQFNKPNTNNEQLVAIPGQEKNLEEDGHRHRHHSHDHDHDLPADHPHHTFTVEGAAHVREHISALGAKAAKALRGGPRAAAAAAAGGAMHWEYVAIAAAGLLIFGISRVVANRHSLKKFFIKKQGYDYDR
jgi:hypothetical protein